MHGEEVGAFQNPEVVIAYFAVAGVLLGCSRFAVVAPVVAEEPAHGAPASEPAPALVGEPQVAMAEATE